MFEKHKQNTMKLSKSEIDLEIERSVLLFQFFFDQIKVIYLQFLKYLYFYIHIYTPIISIFAYNSLIE